MSQYSIEDLQNNLDYIADTKDLIKNAIREKGQEVLDNDTFRSYAAKIDNISGGRSWTK